MKKIIMAILCCLCAGVTFAQKNEASIVIDTKPLKIDSIWLAVDGETIFMVPNKEGKFVHRFSGSFPKSVAFGVDHPVKGNKSLFLEKGNNLNIQTDFNQKAVFSGGGAENNRVLDEYTTLYTEASKNADASAMSPAQYYALGRGMDQASIDILEKSKTKVTSAFYNDASVTLKYQMLNNRVMAPVYYSQGFKKDISTIIPDDYWDLEKEVKMDDNLLANETYTGFMRGAYPLFLNLKELSKEGKVDSMINSPIDERFIYRYGLIKKLYTGKVRSMAMNATFIVLFEYSKDASTLKPMMDEYLAQYASTEDAKALRETYAKMASLAVGKTPPAFTLKDLNGKDVTLKDFAGKVVYMDFWASWCKPCRYEMKNGSPKLHEKFKDNKDVIFLYISIDDREDLWKKAIADDQIKGIHLLSKGGMKSVVGKAFNIQGVPRYVIIGRDGKIFDNDATRPSDDKTPAKLNEALSAK
ncbi:TlpA disulfide reductase family protein [Pedobacter nyackensis]|uniref:TlpA family protein disulfide reductase n=1 Tax=Pedobacter nyackensis TaxID=475255 RepID=UPI00293085F3|nr:TlpA disulfide reductase family protein [Pedobacter nyackensis]